MRFIVDLTLTIAFVTLRPAGFASCEHCFGVVTAPPPTFRRASIF
jgi:hypothetical protein